MALATGTLLAATAIAGTISAGMSIAGGYAKGKEAERVAEYNARIYEQQAGLVSRQKKLESYQYARRIARTRGASVARTAASGITLSGSPLAVMIDTETQQLLDRNVGQYNLEVKRRYALSGAAEYRYRGREAKKSAIFEGYSNAFQRGLSIATIAGGL